MQIWAQKAYMWQTLHLEPLDPRNMRTLARGRILQFWQSKRRHFEALSNFSFTGNVFWWSTVTSQTLPFFYFFFFLCHVEHPTHWGENRARFTTGCVGCYLPGKLRADNIFAFFYTYTRFPVLIFGNTILCTLLQMILSSESQQSPLKWWNCAMSDNWQITCGCVDTWLRESSRDSRLRSSSR